jgi:hypothetical protein
MALLDLILPVAIDEPDDFSIHTDGLSVDDAGNVTIEVVTPDNGDVGDNGDDKDGDDGDLEGILRLGQRLHVFDEIEHLFDDFVAEVEWGNEDYTHDPHVEEDGEYPSMHPKSSCPSDMILFGSPDDKRLR